MKKRLFSILLVLCMALTMLPVTALAEVVSYGNDYDIAINGIKWKFEENDSGECIPVYYYKNYKFSTDADDKIYKEYTSDNLVLTKEGNTVTISFRRGTGNRYPNSIKFTIESKAKGSDISCIEMGNGNNLVITGEGTKGTLTLTRDGKDGIGAALSSKVGDITITGGATVNVTFKKQSTPNVSGHAISVDNHDLIISGEGTTVEATNQSGAPQNFSNDATVMVEGGSLVVSDGAWLKATNEFSNTYKPYPSDFNNYSYFSCAISGDKYAQCTVSVTGEKSRITASAYNSMTYAGTSMGQAYRWADFQVTGAKIEVGNSTESTVDGIKGHQYVTISVPTAPAPHTHTFDDTWTYDATNHWHACTASDCNGIDAIKDKAAHTPGDWIIDKAPNATEAGSKHKECTVCQYKTQTETIPAIGHTHTYDKAWHDMGDEFHAHKCTLCGAFDTASREAHHEFPCESKGLEKGHTLKCLLCEYKYDESIIKPHEWTGWNVYDEYYFSGHHAKRCNCGQLDYRHTQLIYQSIDAEWHQRVCPIKGCGYKEQRKTNHVYENGSTVCKYCNFDKSNPTDPAPVEPTPGGSVIIITPEVTGPVFLSGANQTVAPGSAAAFRIDYNYAAFRSVAVDGVTLAPADYTTWEGSTWVKLTPAYVKTLGIGTHTLSVYFDGATATTTFTVGSQPNPATGARDAVGIAAAAAVIALLGSAALLRKK